MTATTTLRRNPTTLVMERGQYLLDFARGHSTTEVLRHGRAKFGLERTAINYYMAIAREFGDIPAATDCPVDALRVLARPTTARSVLEQAKRRLCEGTTVSRRDAYSLATSHSNPTQDGWADVDLKNILPEEACQREYNPSKTDQIVIDFYPHKVGQITVAPAPDGKFIVIDGQHRVRALFRLGLDRWAVFVKRNATATPAQRAALAYELNDNPISDLNGNDRARIGYNAGIPVIVEVVNLARAAGITAPFGIAS